MRLIRLLRSRCWWQDFPDLVKHELWPKPRKIFLDKKTVYCTDNHACNWIHRAQSSGKSESQSPCR
jgi:hypothetical protein